MKKICDITQEDIVWYNLLTKGKCSVNDSKHVTQYINKIKKITGWKFDRIKVHGVTTYKLSTVAK